MQAKNVLNLQDSQDGNRIKQGDQSIMTYVLQDADNDDLAINGKEAVIYLIARDEVAYKTTTTVKDNSVDLVINKILPKGLYTLEIVVDGKYVYPSDSKAKIEITESVLGKNTKEFEKVSNFEDIVKYAIENHKLDDIVDKKVFEKQNGQIYLMEVNPFELPNMKVPFIFNDKFIKGEVLQNEPNVKGTLRSMFKNGIDNVFYDYNFAEDASNKTEANIRELYADTSEKGLRNNNSSPLIAKYFFPFQITRYENGEVVKQKVCQSTYDLDLDEYLSYTADGGNVVIRYMYKDKPIEFGKYDSAKPPKYTGGGIIKPLPNKNILKNADDFSRIFSDRFTKIPKNDVTFVKLIDDVLFFNQYVNLEPNTEYTISFEVFSDVAKTFSELMVTAGEAQDLCIRYTYPVTNEVSKVQVTFNTRDATRYTLSLQQAYRGDDMITDQIYIGHLKLERGNQATDYVE